MALIALAAVLVLGIPLGIVETARVHNDQQIRLESEADDVAPALDELLARGGFPTSDQLAALAHTGHRITVVVHGRTESGGSTIHGAAMTVAGDALHGGAILASAPRAETDRRVRRTWLAIAGLGVAGVAIATGLAAFESRRLSRPLERVAATSARLGDGDFSARAPRSGVPEIDAIGEALDSSAQRIAALVGREREFSSNISHQLRTPLTALRLRLEELRGADDPGELREELEATLREADRLEAMIADLLAHARSGHAGEWAVIPVAAVVHDHAAIWSPVYARAGRRLIVEDGEAGDVRVLAGRGTLGQVLDVLLDNALRHGEGTVEITVSRDPRSALVAVGDQGPGIAEADAARIFERGATTGEGNGIGLHLAHTLARADGGALRLARRAPPRFELRLRRHEH